MHKQLRALEKFLFSIAVGFLLGFVVSFTVEYFDNDKPIDNVVVKEMNSVLPDIKNKKVSEVVKEIEVEAAKKFIRQKQDQVETRGLIVKKSIEQKKANNNDTMAMISFNDADFPVAASSFDPIHITGSGKILKLMDNPKTMEKPDVMNWYLGCSLDAAIAKYCYLWGYEEKGDIVDSTIEVNKVVGYYTDNQYQTCLWITEIGKNDKIQGYKPLDLDSIQMNIDGYCKDE